MKIAELFAEIGFSVNETGLVEFFKGMDGTIKKVSKFIAMLGAAVFAIKKFTDSALRAAASLFRFREETGLSTQALQRWQNAATFTDIGANAEDVTASISGLQSALQQIQLGQGSTRPFFMFGVSAAQDAFGVLDDLRGKMDMFSPAMTVNLLKEMGLGTEMLHVLKLSNEEFAKLGNSYVLSGEQISNVRKMGVAFNKLGRQLTFVKDEFIAFVSPYLADAARALGYAVRLIVAPFEALGFIIKEVFRIFSTTEGKIAAVVLGLANIGRILKVALFFLRPFVILWGALLLAIEDVVTGMRGGVSIITSLFTIAVFTVANAILRQIRAIRNFARDIGNLIKKYVVEPINDAVDAIRDGVSELGGLLPNLSNISGATPGLINITPIGRAAASLSNLFNNTFNITSTDPTEAASRINEVLQEQLNEGLADFNNVGAY
jgi:hypothetical protein